MTGEEKDDILIHICDCLIGVAGWTGLTKFQLCFSWFQKVFQHPKKIHVLVLNIRQK
jgi:hypothetical protein